MFKFLLLIALSFFFVTNAHAIEWVKTYIPGSGPIYRFYKTGDEIYLGSLGIRKSLDDGTSFSYGNHIQVSDTLINYAGYLRSVVDIYKAKSGTLFASAFDWPIMISKDDGDTWQATSSSDIFNSEDCFYEAGGSVFAFDRTKLIRTTDDGQTWEDVITEVDFMSVNAVVYKDESLVFFDSDYETGTKYFEIYNTNTEELTKKEITIQPEYLYIHKDIVIALSENKVYATNDLGDNWAEIYNLEDKLKSLTQQEGNTFNILGFRADDQVLAVNFITQSSTDQMEQNVAISYDNGSKWEIADISEVMFYGQRNIKIFDGKIYIHGIGVFVYNPESKKFEVTNYTFPVSTHFREFTDYSFCQIISNEDNNYWELSDQSGWQRIEKNTQKYCAFNKDIYTLENDVLTCTRDGEVIDTWNDIVAFKVLRETEEFVFFIWIDLEGTKHFEVDFLSGSNFTGQDPELMDFHSPNEVCYAVKGEQTGYKLIKGILGKLDQADTLNSDFLDQAYPIENLSYDGDKIIIRQNRVVHVSTDGGDNWTLVWGNEEDYLHVNPKCHKDNFYVAGTFGLLKSADGLVWENLLENVCDAYVINYDFVPNGQIYAYTSEGVFISKTPDSVEENEGNSAPEFSLFPNPATNILNIEFADTVESIDLYDLKGRKILTSSDTQIDISNLNQGTYFVKVSSNGKSFFRQFVVVK